MSYLVFKTSPLASILFILFVTNLSCRVFLTTETGFSLSILILSTSAFGLAKSNFAAYLEVSTPVAFLNSAFVA